MAKKMPEAMDYTPVTYDPQYILMVNHLKKYFPIKGGLLSQTVGHVKAVDGVTFNLRRGCTMGLVGESGCGKSTTGRTILRLSGDKTGGQVLFNGKEVYDMNSSELRELRTKMQIIFQDPFSSLSPRLPVGEIIGEAVREHNLVPKNEFDDLCLDGHVQSRNRLIGDDHRRLYHQGAGNTDPLPLAAGELVGIAGAVLGKQSYLI